MPHDPRARPEGAHPGSDDARRVRTGLGKQIRAGLIDVTPAVAYTVSYAISHALLIAFPIAFAVAIVVGAYRLVHKEYLWRVVYFLAVFVIAGLIALLTKHAANLYLPRVATDTALAVASPVLLLCGWPIVGLIMGVFLGEGRAWRRCKIRRHAYAMASLAIYPVQLALLTIELWLYFTGNIIGLGSLDVAQNFVWFAYILIGWPVYRRTLGAHHCEHTDQPAHMPDAAPLV